MKTTCKWKSDIAEAAQDFISLKRQSGLKFEEQERYLRRFDTLYYSNGFEGIILTKEIVNDFIYDPNERPGTHHRKEVLMRDFAIYLADRGHHVYMAKVKTKIKRRKFAPYIFTDDEIRRLFRAIDNHPQARRSHRNAVDPELFRFLYGTGVRISEALNLVLNDVNVKSGIVTIRAAKKMKDRLVPMADSLTKRIAIFVNTFHRYSDCQMWLFPSCHNGKTGQMHHSAAYNHFRDYLLMADIPHTDVGPRIHSFRHGFAVKCLKNWFLNGNDLTVLLPYLSAYMGHSSFRDTQYYLRLTSDLYPEIVRRVEEEFGYVVPEGGGIYDES